MRHAVLFAAMLGLMACDNYADVTKTDTIEAYEVYITENPGTSNSFTAEIRLEELYLKKARTDKTLEAWDAYIARWPKGNHREAAMDEREVFLFAWAEARGTAAGWQTFIKEYPTAKRKRMSKAKAAMKATTFAEAHLTVGELVTTQINMAEDPEGPLNGSSYKFDVTYRGEGDLESMWFEARFLDKDGNAVESKSWPVVAPYVEYPVPVEEEKTVPMKSGETRTWDWWDSKLPEAFSGKVVLMPLRVRVAGQE
jgi:hypothetical protein